MSHIHDIVISRKVSQILKSTDIYYYVFNFDSNDTLDKCYILDILFSKNLGPSAK